MTIPVANGAKVLAYILDHFDRTATLPTQVQIRAACGLSHSQLHFALEYLRHTGQLVDRTPAVLMDGRARGIRLVEG